jgi:hypothetical protein
MKLPLKNRGNAHGTLGVVLLLAAWGIAASMSPLAQEANRSGNEGAVQVQMRNVTYHFQDDVAVHIRQLGGELVPTRVGQIPVFDDRDSFTLHIAAAEITMTPQSLANTLNRNVFAGRDAPIKHIAIRIDKDGLKIQGKVHNKGDISFEAEGKLGATRDGKIRLHADKIKVLHLPVKGLMDLFGVEIADLIKGGKVRGVAAEKDDLILDPEQILPPPHILGKVTEVHLESGSIVQVIGNPPKYPWAHIAAQNYMAYRGNRLQFGKLIMKETDMVLIDADPKDPFDFYLDHYQEQLRAGYSKITKDFGLRVFMVDFNKLTARRPGVRPSE